MAVKKSAVAAPVEPMLIMTRLFDAPTSVVFKAWTEGERLMRWWGSIGFTAPFCKNDPRPGGVMDFCIGSSEGRDFWCKGISRVIVESARVVCTDGVSDEEGNLVQPARYGTGKTDLPTGLCVAASRRGGDRL
jgi:uncharacterized protein YndB with AHSA1/START domain